MQPPLTHPVTHLLLPNSSDARRSKTDRNRQKTTQTLLPCSSDQHFVKTSLTLTTHHMCVSLCSFCHRRSYSCSSFTFHEPSRTLVFSPPAASHPTQGSLTHHLSLQLAEVRLKPGLVSQQQWITPRGALPNLFRNLLLIKPSKASSTITSTVELETVSNCEDHRHDHDNDNTRKEWCTNNLDASIRRGTW